MRVHHVGEAAEIGLVVALQLVAARAQRRRGRLPQQLQVVLGKVGEVVQLVGQHALDAVDATQHAVVQWVQLVRADDAGQAGVDNGGGSAGLCNKAGAHGSMLLFSLIALAHAHQYDAAQDVRQTFSCLLH